MKTLTLINHTANLNQIKIGYLDFAVFSYATLVAVRIDDVLYRTEVNHSSTTNRHIQRFVEYDVAVKECSELELLELFQEALNDHCRRVGIPEPDYGKEVQRTSNK